MLGLATKKNLKEQDGATDYKLEMLYDYIDKVEEKIDGDIESVYEQMQHERTALTVTIMSIAMALNIKPAKLAKVLSTVNMTEYTNKVNDEIDKITAQKAKSVKKK